MAQLRPAELEKNLSNGLAPVYLVAGEEPLVIEESLGLIRNAAREAGYSEREVFHADSSFDWDQLLQARDTLSLFAQRRLIELRLPGGKPGNQGSRALQAFAANPPPDTVLVVATERLDGRQRNSGWAATIASAGVMVYAWPVRADELPRWINQRMRRRGLQPTNDAVTLLAQRAEGNLLAASQEIDKLELVHGQGAVDADAVQEAVVASQRYDVFDLPAAARAGDRARALRIAERLRQADEPPTLVLWALARDLRVLGELQAAPERGEGSNAVLGRHRIPRPQQAGYTQLAARSRRGVWNLVLQRACQADGLVKSAGTRRAWEELIQLADEMAQTAAGEEPRRVAN